MSGVARNVDLIGLFFFWGGGGNKPANTYGLTNEKIIKNKHEKFSKLNHIIRTVVIISIDPPFWEGYPQFTMVTFN